MEFTEQGLVLRVGRFREADLWVRFLSRRRGILTAFAFGGSRSRRRFAGCLDIFNMLSVSVKSTRRGDYLALQEATLLRGPDRLRHDWRRCGMATNCLRFVEALGAEADFGTLATRFPSQATVLQKIVPQESLALQCGEMASCVSASHGGLCCELMPQGDTPLGQSGILEQSGTFLGQASQGHAHQDYSPLDLALDMLSVLEQAPDVHALFPILFRARYAFSQGYEPRFGHCSHCGCMRHDHDRHRFMVREGTMLCTDCLARLGTSGPFVDVARETLDALHFVQDTSPLHWPQLCLSPSARREFSRAVDGFIQYHIGLTWENGRFRRL